MKNALISGASGPLVLGLIALAMAIAISAANTTYAVHLLSHPTVQVPILDMASKLLVWLAILNKPIVPIAFHVSQDPMLSPWTQITRTLGALFGVAGGMIAGFYVLLWTYGKITNREGGAFGWSALSIFKWTCVAACSAYILLSMWYIFEFRESFEMAVAGRAMGNAAGLYAITILEYILLSIVGHYGRLLGHAWFGAKKKW